LGGSAIPEIRSGISRGFDIISGYFETSFHLLVKALGEILARDVYRGGEAGFQKLIK